MTKKKKELMMEESQSKTFIVTAQRSKYNSFHFRLIVNDFVAI